MVAINRDPVEGVSVYSIIFRPLQGGYLKPPAMRVVDDWFNWIEATPGVEPRFTDLQAVDANLFIYLIS